MTPTLLVVLGAHSVLLVGTIALVYHLGRFVPTAAERRAWAIGVPLLVAWGVLLAVIGPLPQPLSLGFNLVVLGFVLWAWRTGRFSLDAVPTEMRPEVRRRRRWMREHVGLLLGILGAYLVANLALAIGAVRLLR